MFFYESLSFGVSPKGGGRANRPRASSSRGRQKVMNSILMKSIKRSKIYRKIKKQLR